MFPGFTRVTQSETPDFLADQSRQTPGEEVSQISWLLGFFSRTSWTISQAETSITIDNIVFAARLPIMLSMARAFLEGVKDCEGK